MTTQRKVILDELRRVKTHPTAEEIHELVKKELPRMSLATVYRNLDYFASRGLIKKLDAAGAKMRYDAEVAPHFHLVCRVCGGIEDAHLKPVQNLERVFPGMKALGVDECRIEFIRVCPRCRGEAGSEATREGGA